MTQPVNTDGIDQVVEQTKPDLSEGTDTNQTASGDEGADANLDDTGAKDAETLRQERATAVKEAIKHSKRAKEQESELEYKDQLLDVMRVPDNIIKIHNADPALAERIAKDAFGKNYAQLFEESDKQPTQDIESLIDKKIREREEASTREKSQASIDNALIDFLVDNNITQENVLFRKITKEFGEYSPKSEKQAKNILRSIYAEHSDDVPVIKNNAPTMSSRSSIGKIEKGKGVSDSMRQLLVERNLSVEEFKKHQKS